MSTISYHSFFIKELATAPKLAWLLVPLVLLQFLLLGFINLIHCDFKHLDLAFDVEQSVAFLLLRRCLHLGHDLCLDA